MDLTGICLNCFSARGAYDVCPYCGFVAGTPPPLAYLLHPGTRLWGRYVVGTVLGVGGFGATYKAWDTRLNTLVAIKEFFPQNLVSRIPGEVKVRAFSGDKLMEYHQQLMRFMDEARNMAKFTGDVHIVNVFDFFEDNGTAYIVMEYLDGWTLKEHMDARGGTLPPAEAMAIIESILKAVENIHQKGIIHRDISPDNIYVLRDGRVKVLDFGAARFAVRDNAELTQNVVVKKGYAPPEQYRNNMKQGVWTDIYAVGATLYKMLTGITPEESIERTVKDTLKRPSQCGVAVDVTVDKVIMKAMALKQEIRFKSAAQMLAALQNQTTIDFPEQEMKKRRVTRAATMVLAVVSVLAVGVFATWQFTRGNLSGQTLANVNIKPDTITIVSQNYGTATEALHQMAEEFNSRHPDYQVIVSTYEYDVMTDEIIPNYTSADAPVMMRAYSNENVHYNEYAADLSLLYDSLDVDDYYFLQDYVKYYPEKNVMPMDFYMLAAYGSDARAEFQGVTLPDKITSFGQVLDFIEPGAAYAELDFYDALCLMREFEPGFYQNGKYRPELVKDDFERYVDMRLAGGFDRDKDQYYSNHFYKQSYMDAGNLRRAQQDWPGAYRLIPVEDKGKPLAFLGSNWCVNKHASKNKQYVAMLFMHYMLSENGQHYMCVQNDGDFPLNKKVMDSYLNINQAFKPYFSPGDVKNYEVCSFYGNRPLPEDLSTQLEEMFDAKKTKEEIIDAFMNYQDPA